MLFHLLKMTPGPYRCVLLLTRSLGSEPIESAFSSFPGQDIEYFPTVGYS